MTDKEVEDVHNEVIGDLYRQYELDHEMDVMRYHHPMFYNGTFSKDNSYQPEKPKDLLGKNDFDDMINEHNADMLGEHDPDSKWRHGYEVLFSYIAKSRRKEMIQT